MSDHTAETARRRSVNGDLRLQAEELYPVLATFLCDNIPYYTSSLRKDCESIILRCYYYSRRWSWWFITISKGESLVQLMAKHCILILFFSFLIKNFLFEKIKVLQFFHSFFYREKK